MENLTVIERLLAETVPVAVGDYMLHLHHPAAADTLAVRTMLIDMAGTGDKVAGDKSITVAAAAVKACIPGLDNDGATRLVAAAPGGELSELVASAFRMCGLNATANDSAGEDAGLEDPS